MSNKYMACNTLNGEFVPFQAFQEAQNSFYFAKKDLDVCYVTPYVIVTDGHDMLVRENDGGSIQVGWRYKVNRPNVWSVPNTPEEFNKIVEEDIKKHFISMWKKITTDINNISVHTTNRGFYSLNQKRFYPVYFISIPNDKPVNFFFKGEQNCYPMMISKLAAAHGNLPTTYAARKIMEMINAGEIILPEVRDG